SSLASENTLNAGDVIDGGAGSDILRVDLKSNFTGLDSNGVIKGVEKLSLLNSGLISRTFDAKGIKDVQTLALNSEKGIEVKNLANIADIELTNLQAANFNLDTIYADKVLDGNADTQNLKVNGVGAQGAGVTVTADKIENLSLNATGKDSFLKDISSKDVSVKGNGNITLQAKAGVSSLDASASSGKVSADLTAANVKTIKGGSGDDKFVIGTSVANVSVDGGAGNDELEISGTGTLKPTVANVEKVTLNATGALTLAMDNAKDVSELNIKGDTGGVTVVNSNISALNFLSTATGAVANVTTVDSANLATINYKAGTEEGEVKGNLTATKATNLTVNTDALANITDANAIVTANVATSMSLNINATKTAQSLTLNAAKLKDLVVTNKSVGGFTVKGAANSLDTLSNLNVTTDGGFKFDTIDGLAGVSTVTLSGTNDNSAVTLGTLGKAEATQGIALNASGLKAGLTVGNTSTKGSININLNAMSGDATLGTADSKTDNLTISANGVEGNLKTEALTSAASTTVSLTNVKGASTIASLTAATASLAIENTGNVTITSASTASAGDFSINANNASGLTTNAITAAKGAISINANGVSTIVVGALSAKSVTLNAGDASTSVKTGAISAESVNVDLSKVLGTTTVGKITSDNIVYKASELSADTAGKIELSSKGTTQNFKADVTGSLGNDKIELTTVATTSSVTLSGDLGVGNDIVEINKSAAVEALKSVNLSGLTNYATSETKLKAAASDTLTFNGGSGNDNVEVSGTDIASLTITGDFGEGGTDKLTLGTSGTAITGANSAVTIDITKVTNVDSTEINFTNGATDMSTKALTINGSNSNDQVTLKLVAATTKVKVNGDLG
ncbi:beta strand repeat-containing protein, partial [Campylobacter fetus]